MDLLDAVGWTGSTCLIVCGLPQLIKTIRIKKIEGLSILFLLLWFSGEFLSLFYVIGKTSKLPLILNYSINLTVTVILITYYIMYRGKNGRQ
jgi:uncharacterized protein with PQ loop repeat